MTGEEILEAAQGTMQADKSCVTVTLDTLGQANARVAQPFDLQPAVPVLQPYEMRGSGPLSGPLRKSRR